MVPQDFEAPERTKREFELLPEGLYNVELISVDVIEEKDPKKEQMNKKLNFTFAIIDEGKYYGRRLWDKAFIVMSIKPKVSNLVTILQKLTGKTYTEEDCKNYKAILTSDFLNSLIGIQKQVNVAHVTAQTTGRVRAELDSYIQGTKVELPPFDETKIQKESPAPEAPAPQAQ